MISRSFMPVFAVFLMSAMLVFIVALPTQAQQDASGQNAKIQEMLATNPHAPRLEEMARELHDTLNEGEIQRLMLVRTNFGMLRSIEIVREDVQRAARMCGEANPEMSEKLDETFAAWDAEVRPRLEKQAEYMDNAVEEQNFNNPSQVREFLDQLDRTAQYANTRIDKTPVTTPQACGALMTSMASTGTAITQALDMLIWPGDDGVDDDGLDQAD